jgi:hypothetical protein
MEAHDIRKMGTQMTDIVERLRVHPSDNGGPSWSEMLLERADAASEIERLRAGGCARDQTTTQFCAEAAAMSKEIERLRAASQWQPIKTAPKDGTQIIVIDATNDQQWVAFWSTSAWVGGAWIPYENRSDTISISATHWQPLPSPPIQEGGK